MTTCLQSFCGRLTLLLAVALTPASADAIENCKVKIDRRDGTLLVSAKSVGANPRWGFLPGEESEPFFNESECIRNGKLRKCVLGGPDTPERITPPDLCTLYLADGGSTDCAAYIKGCVPGARKVEVAPGRLIVRDTNGAIVGPVLDAPTGGLVSVLRRVNDVLLKFVVTEDGFAAGACPLRYESTDCTGPVFISGVPEGLAQPALVSANGKVYYAIGPSHEALAQSERCGSECLPNVGSDTLSEFAEFDLSSLGLVPPFRIEVE